MCFQNVVQRSPPPIADEILYAAQLCGVQEILTSAARRRLPPGLRQQRVRTAVDKISGPGNAFVTGSCCQVSQRPTAARVTSHYASRAVQGTGDRRQRRNTGFRRF